MAERYAVQNGPFHLASTWDGGTTVPGDTDDVHAGGYEVTIHTSIKVKSLRLAAGSSAPAGGRFVVGPPDLDPGITIEVTDGILAAHHQSGNASSGSRTYILWVLDPDTPVTVIAPKVEGAGAYRTGIGVNVTGSAPNGTGGGTLILDAATLTGGSDSNAYAVRVDGTTATVDITGTITGGSGSNAYGLYVTGGTVDITGDITSGSGSGNSAYGLYVTGGTVDITGDITGGSGNGAYGLQVSGGTVDVTGDITGGSGSNAYGLYVTGGTVDVTGDITGGSANGAYGVLTSGSSVVTIHDGSTITGGTSSAYGIQHQSNQPITIHANITGGAAASNYGLNLPGAYTANITGTITGGSAATAAGINATNNTVINHTGDVHGSPTHNAPGIQTAGTCKIRIDGTLHASEHAPAVTGENTTPIAIKHAQNHPNGQAATQCKMWIIWDADDATWGVYTDLAWPDDPEGSAAVLTRFGTDLPAQADVRLNTTYGPGGNLTGTLEAGGASLADIAAVTGAQIQAATNTD